MDTVLHPDQATATPDTPVTLDAEWQRVSALIRVAEALRIGQDLPDGFEGEFALLQDQVARAREAGAWAAMRGLMDEGALANLTPHDIDLLALALAPEASPVLAPRLHALQPFVNAPCPALPLVQELLMLDTAEDVAAVMTRLEPAAPLVGQNLVQLERQGDYLCLRPTPRTIRAFLGRTANLGPPPGADQVPLGPGWDELILPETTHRRLSEFVAWITRRDQVFGAWAGRPIGGPLALFSGPSGVGKSFAVTVLARELGRMTGQPWLLYRLDLGRIVSKYVGETEKNLNALLNAVHGTRALLQVDEADGLLGKRGEVTEARDRYANLEVSHMLSRFERHDGPVILTSNLRTNIDAAFVRRFQVLVDFPAPDAAMRTALWERLLPASAPREKALDFSELGATVPLSGGGIHNAAIYAAVLAAEDEAPIGPAHVARAAWCELGKEARKVRRCELGALAAHLGDEE